MRRERLVGALLGWKRQPSENGIVITLQVLTVDSAEDRQHVDVSLALNERQIRSLARDMQRAANARGIRLWSRPKWWQAILASARRDAG